MAPRRHRVGALEKLKLLMPAEWESFLKSRTEFAKEWDRYTGLR